MRARVAWMRDRVVWCGVRCHGGAYPGAGELCLMPRASAKMMHHSQALYVFSVYVGACHTYHIRAANKGLGWGGRSKSGRRQDV